ADDTRIEERDLHVIPVLAVDGTVPLQTMIEEFALPADLVVRQLAGVIRARNDELRLSIRAGGVRRPAVLIEATRAESLRVGVVEHQIGREMPGEVAAALEAGLGVAQVGPIQVEGLRLAADCGGSAVKAAETACHAAVGGVVEAEVARPGGDGQDLRNDVEVHRCEEGRLLCLAYGVLVKGSRRRVDAGEDDGRSRGGADVCEAAGVAG